MPSGKSRQAPARKSLLGKTAAIAQKARIMRKGHRPSQPHSGKPRLWGRHAVLAALDNPARTIRKLWGTREALSKLSLPSDLPYVYAEVADLGRMIPSDAPHQGLVAEVEPLADVWLGDLLADIASTNRPLVVLDQVTDPHNVGAILRSASAFGAAGLITQDRHAPPEGGVIARAACGALEHVPWVRVVNLARALEEIAEAGYWRIGLAGEARQNFADTISPAKIALVLGAEGEGLRQNVAAHCDELARLPISNKIESLNVSNAAAIALYAVATR